MGGIQVTDMRAGRNLGHREHIIDRVVRVCHWCLQVLPGEPVESGNSWDPFREVLINKAKDGTKELNFKLASVGSGAEGLRTTLGGMLD